MCDFTHDLHVDCSRPEPQKLTGPEPLGCEQRMRIVFQRKSLSVARNSIIFSEIENEFDFKMLEVLTMGSGLDSEGSVGPRAIPGGCQLVYNFTVYLSQDPKYGPYTADKYLIKNPSLFRDDISYISWKANVISTYPLLDALFDRVEEEAEIHNELQRQTFIRDRLFKSNQDRIDELKSRLAALNPFGGSYETSFSLR